MKSTLLIMLILSEGAIALASQPITLTTVSGQTYSNVDLKRVEPDAVVVMTPKGVVSIAFTDLQSDVQQRYGYNPTNAAAYAKQRAATRRITGQQSAAARQRAQSNKESVDDNSGSSSFPLNATQLTLSEGVMSEHVLERQESDDVSVSTIRKQSTKTYTIEAVVENGTQSRKQFEAVYGDRSIRDVVQPMKSVRIKITATERSALKLICDGKEKEFL